MGYGSYTSADWAKLKHSTRITETSTAAQIFTSRKLLEAFDPRFIHMREARDSQDHPVTTPVMIGLDVTGKELQNRLDEVYITVNKNTVPGEPRSPFVTSGIRIGTPAVTTRGLKEADMEKLAELIDLAIRDFDNQKDYIRSEVVKLTEKYPIYQ